jgi:hypothetical protein
MKIIMPLLIASLILSNSIFAQKRNKKEPPMGTFVSEAQFKDYIPISPLEFEQNVIIYDTTLKTFDTLSIKKLATRKSEIIRFLPNETVYSTLEKRDGSLDLKFGPAALTGEAGAYTVTLDYAKFTTLKYNIGNNCAGFTKVGVGMRITAKITTYEAGIDVSSLFGLGVQAKAGKISGQLSIDIIGMESSQITDLITLPVDISESSIQTALQSLSAIKSKMYDVNTNLFPQILAIKKTDGACSVFDLLDKIDNSGANTIKTTNQQQQQQQQQQQLQQQN